jgi:ABC-type uncharacterized transport system substrate-binding protein
MLGISLIRAARAQVGKAMYRVGVLSAGSAATSGHIIEAFKQSMRERGYIEGANVVFDVAYAEGNFDRLEGLAKRLIASRPNVLVSAAPQMIRVLKQSAGTIPIVMAQVVDPVGNGFVASLARPGGNITGIANQYEEALPKIFEILSVLVPKLDRAGILINETHSLHATYWATSASAASQFGMKALKVGISRREDLEPAFAAMAQAPVQAVVVTPDPFFLAYRRDITDFALRHRLPTGYGITEHVSAGGLFGYGPDLVTNYRRAAYFVDRILKGASPAELPVEQPLKFELVINRATARALGLTIPQSVMVRADKLID